MLGSSYVAVVDNIVNQTNWVDAVKHCTSLNTKLYTSISNSSSGVWSRYFRYKRFQSKAGKYHKFRLKDDSMWVNIIYMVFL